MSEDGYTAPDVVRVMVQEDMARPSHLIVKANDGLGFLNQESTWKTLNGFLQAAQQDGFDIGQITVISEPGTSLWQAHKGAAPTWSDPNGERILATPIGQTLDKLGFEVLMVSTHAFASMPRVEFQFNPKGLTERQKALAALSRIW